MAAYAPSVPVSDISVGVEHGCATRMDGLVTCWGGNTYGESSVAPPILLTVPAPEPTAALQAFAALGTLISLQRLGRRRRLSATETRSSR